MAQNNDGKIKQLIIKVQQLETRLNQKKFQLQTEIDENTSLRNMITRLKSDKKELRNEMEILQKQLNTLRSNLREHQRESHALRPITVYKKWDEIRSSKTKLKRKMQYRDLIDNSMRYVTECKRAKMTLTLGNEDVDLKWTEEDMQNHRNQLGVHHQIDTPGSTNPINDTGNDDETITNSKLKYSKNYLSTIVTWMDDHRISHRAYNDMKHIIQGHVPSLTQIKIRRNQMSLELTFHEHKLV